MKLLQLRTAPTTDKPVNKEDEGGNKKIFTEWQGDWADKSELWTPELKEQLDFESKDDGIFWMPLESFVEFFVGIHICKYVDGH